MLHELQNLRNPVSNVYKPLLGNLGATFARISWLKRSNVNNAKFLTLEIEISNLSVLYASTTYLPDVNHQGTGRCYTQI